MKKVERFCFILCLLTAGMYQQGYRSHYTTAKAPDSRMNGQKDGDSIGIWIQTSSDNMALWKKRISDSLIMYGYSMKQSNDFDQSIHMEFRKGKIYAPSLMFPLIKVLRL